MFSGLVVNLGLASVRLNIRGGPGWVRLWSQVDGDFGVVFGVVVPTFCADMSLAFSVVNRGWRDANRGNP